MNEIRRPEAAARGSRSATVGRRLLARRAQFAAAAIRTGVRALEVLAPPAAGAVVERLWFTPPRPPATAVRRHTDLAGAAAISVRVNGRDLGGWTLGDGPHVMLVHGWGGWAGQLVPIARALADAGLAATAIDLPGHGADTARRSDLFQAADALRALADQRGAPALIIAHSFGTLAATLAFAEDPPPAAVFVAPALSTEAALTQFAGALRLRPSTADDLRARLLRFTGDAWLVINRGADLTWPDGPLLVIHDRDDPRTPFELSAALAARHDHVELLEVSGPGHNRVLRDPAVVGAVVRFAAAHIAAQPA